MSGSAIAVSGLRKTFGDKVVLDGIDFEVPTGSIFSLLGPNGAGKTTTVNVLTTLVTGDGGTVRVGGHDVATETKAVRGLIGVTGQFAAIDELLTGRENLEMIGRLFHLPASVARSRAAELLDRFELVDAADRTTKTYSGGMRRRLDLAGALVAEPPVLFLDEPTTGLDPRSRLSMWDLIADLAKGGTTLLMTTQYLEEADRLADDIVVIDHGRVIARGTASELKRRLGGERLEVSVERQEDVEPAAALLAMLGEEAAQVDLVERRVSVAVASVNGVLTRAIRELDAAGIAVNDAGFRRPTLDEVFLNLTGHPAEDAAAGETINEVRR